MKLARLGTWRTPRLVERRRQAPHALPDRLDGPPHVDSSSRAASAATWASVFTLNGWRMRFTSAMQSGSATA